MRRSDPAFVVLPACQRYGWKLQQFLVDYAEQGSILFPASNDRRLFPSIARGRTMPQTDFDVFLSHNSKDKPEVFKLATKLKDIGLNPWLDAWHLVAGEPWLPAIERALRDCGACAVVVGPHGLGDVHEVEMWVALQRSIESKRGDRRFRVIPILLPNCTRGDRARLPSFLTANTWVEFQRSIDEPAALDKLKKAIRGEPPGPGVKLAGGECPYRGLAYFDIQHEPLFFGREALTDWLLSRLRGTASKDGSTRFLAIVGASGSGKSSLARAGVLAKLKQGELSGSARWPLVMCRPESRPLESLATALAHTDGVNLGTGLKATLIRQLADELSKSPEQLHLVAQGAMPANDSDWRLVVFVDQFEELFTLNEPDARGAQATSQTPALSSDRVACFQNLLRAATIENGRTIVILTMRADFYGKCAAFPELATAVSQHQELVGPMSADELRRAVETPAQLSGSDIEPGLVDLLTREVADQPGALPLLQYALAELWQKSRDLGFSKLTTSAYHELGGWEGALSRRADAVLAEFKNTPQENLCRQLFLRLVQPGEGTEDTKRLVRWQELERDNAREAAALEQTVRKLADNRLITTSGDDLNADSTIEVVHEALIRSWPELRQWLDADRANLLIHRRLDRSAQEWQSHGRDKSYLYTGGRLRQMETWRKANNPALNDLECDFLRSSRLRGTWKRLGLLTVTTTLLLAVWQANLVISRRQFRKDAHEYLLNAAYPSWLYDRQNQFDSLTLSKPLPLEYFTWLSSDRIESLSLVSNSPSLTGLSSLSECSKLKTLVLRYPRGTKVRDVSSLAALKNLKELRLDVSAVGSIDLSTLSSLYKLERLTLHTSHSKIGSLASSGNCRS